MNSKNNKFFKLFLHLIITTGLSACLSASEDNGTDNNGSEGLQDRGVVKKTCSADPIIHFTSNDYVYDGLIIKTRPYLYTVDTSDNTSSRVELANQDINFYGMSFTGINVASNGIPVLLGQEEIYASRNYNETQKTPIPPSIKQITGSQA